MRRGREREGPHKMGGGWADRPPRSTNKCDLPRDCFLFQSSDKSKNTLFLIKVLRLDQMSLNVYVASFSCKVVCLNGKRFWQSLKGGKVDELVALVSTFEKERFERLDA